MIQEFRLSPIPSRQRQQNQDREVSPCRRVNKEEPETTQAGGIFYVRILKHSAERLRQLSSLLHEDAQNLRQQGLKYHTATENSISLLCSIPSSHEKTAIVCFAVPSSCDIAVVRVVFDRRSGRSRPHSSFSSIPLLYEKWAQIRKFAHHHLI